MTQVQDPALRLDEPHTRGLDPSIQPIQRLPALQQPFLVSSENWLKAHFIHFSKSVIKILHRTGPSWVLGSTICDWPLTGCNSIPRHSQGSIIQADFYPAHIKKCRILWEKVSKTLPDVQGRCPRSPHSFFFRESKTVIWWSEMKKVKSWSANRKHWNVYILKK